MGALGVRTHARLGGRAQGARLLAASLRLPFSGDRLPGLLLEAAIRNPPAPEFRLGRNRAILLTSPRDVARVLVQAAGESYEKPARMTGLGMRSAAGSGVLTSRGPEASRRRRLVAPLLRGEAVAGYERVAAELTAARLDRWLSCGSVDLFADLIRLQRLIALETIVGPRWPAAAPELEAELERRRARMTGAVRGRLDPRARPRPGSRGLEAALAGVIGAVRRDPGGESVLERLAAASDEDETIVAEARTLMLSAYETVGAAIAWTLLELSRSPEHLPAVIAEARSPEKGGTERKRATARAVDEALRLHPSVFRFHRVALRADRLPSGTEVPAGRILVVSPFVLGRLPQLWQGAEEFDPGRFDPVRVSHDKYAYIPFGAGPRVCIARRLALLQARSAVAELCAGLDLGPLARAAPDPTSARRRPRCRVEALPR